METLSSLTQTWPASANIDAEGDGLDPIELWKLVRRAGRDGGGADVVLRRMARLGDGWMPNTMDLDQLAEELSEFDTPASHASAPCNTPSPQISTSQDEEQPSPSATLPSSQRSPASVPPSPHPQTVQLRPGTGSARPEPGASGRHKAAARGQDQGLLPAPLPRQAGHR